VLRRRLAWGVVGVVAVLVVGLVVWDRDFRQASGQIPGMTCPQVVRPSAHEPLAAIGVHRVALVGDSIMEQASCSVADSLARVGLTTYRYAVAGSGLLTGFVDWPSRIAQILRADHPDVVAAIFVGNYIGPPVRNATGQPIADNTPAFFAAWQMQAERISAEVLASGAQMFWVSPPPIVRAPLNWADRLFDGYRAIPGDHVLLSGRVLAGSGGQEVLAKQTCGHLEVVRSLDHTHLSDAGARLYGEQIAHDLTSQLGILVTPKPC
jgi:hypothetical protein